MGRNRYTDEDKAEWLSLYTGGATLAEIAEKYGCSQQYVSKCIKFQKEKPPETKENISGDTEEHDYPENILSQPNEDVNYSVEEQRDPEKMPDKPTLDGLVISIRKILGDNVTGVLNFTVSGKKYGLRLK